MKRFLAWTAAIILGAALLCLAFYLGTGFILSPQDKLEHADAIVAISGGRTTVRADKAIELYKKGYAPLLIFSGAALDDGPSNAFAMRDQALAQGVPAKDILIDQDAQNTYQNATNTKKILDETGGHSLILVTSPYHQRRADMTFRFVLGPSTKVLGVSSVDDRWSKSQWWRRGFPLTITVSELYKLIYIQLTGNYQ